MNTAILDSLKERKNGFNEKFSEKNGGFFRLGVITCFCSEISKYIVGKKIGVQCLYELATDFLNSTR